MKDKQGGRTGFAEMEAYLKKHACRTILVEKTDRLYRNLKDWSTLDELGVTIQLVKGKRHHWPESRSSEQLVHGIKVPRNSSAKGARSTAVGSMRV